MKRIKSKEIAFLNILKYILAPDLNKEIVNYTFSLFDLEEKIDMDKQIISMFIKKLNTVGFINILSEQDEVFDIDFDRTYKKLLEIIPHTELDDLVDEMGTFIENHVIKDLEFIKFYSNINKYAKKALKLVETQGEKADFSDLIEAGVKELFHTEDSYLKISQIILGVCDELEEKELKVLEGILYSFFSLPTEENPFYITLFLVLLAYEMEKISIK